MIQDNKHNKYFKDYIENDLYWGLGIENELYLEFSKPLIVDSNFLKNNKRERYSVDYFTSYNLKHIKKSIDDIINKNNKYVLPFLINSHSLSKCDINGNHKTLYTKLNETNPNFTKPLIDSLIEIDPYFNNNNYIFDGDTIEIMTRNYYKTTLQDIIEEIKLYKAEFIEHLQKCQEELGFFKNYGNINWMNKNYEIACFLTNMDNIGIFCNGTIHYNVTLPTLLDNDKNILNYDAFVDKHRIYIRLIQYFEPLLVAYYGSPDPFPKCSKASQRCAISRYISLGTYNTKHMIIGKLLTVQVKELPKYFWYNKYHKNSKYVKLQEIGCDINFNKFKNHGIEIRFFDHMSNNQMYESFQFICLLGDLALHYYENNIDVPNVAENENWHNLIVKIFKHGKEYNLEKSHIKMYNKLLAFESEGKNVTEVYQDIRTKLINKYWGIGGFSKYINKSI